MVFIKKNLFYLYGFILSLQMVLASHYLTNLLPLTIPDYAYYEGTAIYFNPLKKSELLGYLLGIVVIGIWFSGLFLGKEKIERYTKYSFVYLISKITGLGMMIASLLIFPALIYVSHFCPEIKLGLSLLLVVFCSWLPYGFKGLSRKEILANFEEHLKNLLLRKQSLDISKFYKVLILLAYIQLVALFYEPIFQNIKIITEYYNVNEKVVVDHKYIDKQKTLNSIVSNVGSSGFGNGLVKSEADILNPGQMTTSNFNLTNENKLFLKENTFELHWQILSRFMIHHNSFIYIPAKEFELNKPVEHINSQYGLGISWLLSKVFVPFGGISIDKWLRFSYIAYYVYFLLFIILTQLLVRDWRFTAIIFLLSMRMINNRGYDFLLLPPGESPWRHFFDLWVVFFIYYFGRNQNILYYWMALAFGVLSIFINPQIGLMVFVSVILVGVYYLLLQKNKNRDMIIALIVSVLIAFLCFQITNSASDLAKYYIDGVIGFPIKIKQLMFFLLLITIGYSISLYLMKRLELKQLLPLLFLFFYSQALLVYVVWHYNSDGLSARAFIYILTIGLMFYYMAKAWPYKVQNILWIIITGYAFSTYVSSVKKVIDSKKEYNKIFETHKTYKWDMPNAHFISTMNPQPFKNDANLIRKYSSQNGVYIISEYDNILPFLANKYSQMPFFDLKWYLITPREVQKSIDLLKNDQPKYLYIDAGIDRDYENEIIDIQMPIIGYLYQESIWRVQRLKLLRVIFSQVRDQYELIEEGKMISVYKRKDKNEMH